MLMILGAIMFTLWLVATMAFIWRLMYGRPIGLQMAVLAYFVTASTFNSFGRKDQNYVVMVCAVTCAARALSARKEKREEREVLLYTPGALHAVNI